MSDLKYNPFDYLNTQQLKYSKQYTERELRAAYSYLRTIALKRLHRLENAGYTQGAQYQRLRALGLPYVRDIKNRSELAMMLQQTAFFVSLKTSTVSGIKQVRRDKIQQFRNMGFNVTTKNFDNVIEFFEHVKRVSGNIYNIKMSVDVYNYGVRERIPLQKLKNDYSRIAKKLGYIDDAGIKNIIR